MQSVLVMISPAEISVLSLLKIQSQMEGISTERLNRHAISQRMPTIYRCTFLRPLRLTGEGKERMVPRRHIEKGPEIMNGTFLGAHRA